MEVRVKVPNEIAARAHAQGIPVENYVEQLLAEQVPAQQPRKFSNEMEIRAWLDSLAQFSRKIPELPHTITREWIYQDHD